MRLFSYSTSEDSDLTLTLGSPVSREYKDPRVGLQVALSKGLQGHAWVSAVPSDLDQEWCVTSDRGAASKHNNFFPVKQSSQIIPTSWGVTLENMEGAD